MRLHIILKRDTSGLLVFAKDKQSMSFLQKAFRERNVEKEYEALVCGHLSNDVNDGCIDLPLQRDHRFPPFMRAATPESEKQAQRVVKDLNHAGWKKIIKKKAKPSKTLFRVMSREFVKDVHDPSKLLPVTRLHLTPVTGRTHQLRVHCAAIGHPILGDPAYGIMGEASPFGGFEYKSIANIMPSMAKNRLQLELDKYVKESKQCMCLHARKLKLNHPISGQEMQFQEPPKF
jgi:23S rRNA-/tRNA-specific pseudouridylate synthase